MYCVSLSGPGRVPSVLDGREIPGSKRVCFRPALGKLPRRLNLLALQSTKRCSGVFFRFPPNRKQLLQVPFNLKMSREKNLSVSEINFYSRPNDASDLIRLLLTRQFFASLRYFCKPVTSFSLSSHRKVQSSWKRVSTPCLAKVPRHPQLVYDLFLGLWVR